VAVKRGVNYVEGGADIRRKGSELARRVVDAVPQHPGTPGRGKDAEAAGRNREGGVTRRDFPERFRNLRDR
jgi:hypothetical protein